MIDCAFNVSEKTIYLGFNKFEKYQILFMLGPSISIYEETTRCFNNITPSPTRMKMELINLIFILGTMNSRGGLRNLIIRVNLLAQRSFRFGPYMKSGARSGSHH